METWTIEDELLTAEYFDDDETWIHDEDSDRPMELID